MSVDDISSRVNIRRVGSMLDIDLIIFDMDGTLYPYENGVDDLSKTEMFTEIRRKGVEFVATKLSVSETNAEEIINHMKIKYGDVTPGLNAEYGINTNEFFNAAWDVDPSRYVNYDAGLRSFLLSFHQKKAVLTAAPKVWAKRLLQYLNIYDVFDGIWTRDDKLRKPDMDVYKMLFRHFNTEPNRSMVIDDNVRLLKQPKELGICTVLVSKEPSSKKESADFTVRNVTEIVRIPKLVKLKF